VGTADNRRESLDAPSEHARQPHTGAEHLRLNASVSGALRGTEGSNLASSSGESANRRSLARSGSLQSTLPAQAPSWGMLSALRLVHSAGVTRIALLTKRRFSVGSAQTQPRVIFTARDRRPTPRAACLRWHLVSRQGHRGGAIAFCPATRGAGLGLLGCSQIANCKSCGWRRKKMPLDLCDG
jgi:hypothetical protein